MTVEELMACAAGIAPRGLRVVAGKAWEIAAGVYLHSVNLDAGPAERCE
jgi:hypothetical protein